MTIKGICRSCFGDVFESDEKVNAYAELYHICWREEEVCVCVCLSVWKVRASVLELHNSIPISQDRKVDTVLIEQ